MYYEESKNECHHMVDGHSAEVTSGWYLNDEPEDKWQAVPSRENHERNDAKARKCWCVRGRGKGGEGGSSRGTGKAPGQCFLNKKNFESQLWTPNTHLPLPSVGCSFCWQSLPEFSCSSCCHKMHEVGDLKSSSGSKISPMDPGWDLSIQRAWWEKSESLGERRVTRALWLWYL